MDWEKYLDKLLRAKFDWEDRAECKKYGPNKMFPPGHNAQATVAEEICGNCPVKAECLVIAIATEERYGVWGGTTELDRIEMIRRVSPIPNSDKPLAIEKIVNKSLGIEELYVKAVSEAQ